MIEMLGVLAIIGVLSVGGIAGYSKAMTKFKINKTANAVTHLVTNIRTLYAKQTTYDGLDTQSAINMGVVPSSFGTSSAAPYITHDFNGSIYISTPFSDVKEFFIALKDLTPEACMQLGSYDWGSTSSSGLVAMAITDNTTHADIMWGSGCYENTGSWLYACSGGQTVGIPIPLHYVEYACNSHTKPNLILKFQ